jgi:hypothetical protein
MFGNFLRTFFKHRAGRSYVDRGDYELMTNDSLIINPTTWDTIIKPGVTINMNAILRLLGLDDSDSRRCPGCARVCPQASLNSQVQW